MAGQVKRREVYEDDFYGPLGQSAKEASNDIQDLTLDLIEQANVLENDLKKALFNNTKEINKFLASTKKANKLRKESVSNEKAEARAIKQKTLIAVEAGKIKRDNIKTTAAESRESQRLAKQKIQEGNAQKRNAKIIAEESDAYKQLSKKTREQKNESKRLAVEMIKLAESGRRNSKEYRKVATQYRQVTSAAKKADKTLKRIDATVGDNFRNVGNYASGLSKVRGALVRVAGALGLFSAARNITGIIVDFDQAQGDLQAISGKTEKQLASLTEQARELGGTSQFTATQITEMQIELAKLGFTSQQINNSTKAVSNFAAATGGEIADAAQLAGSAMRGFGLDASEMERVVSTLGVATTKSGLTFEGLHSNLSTIAPVARAFGFSIEDTTALLGELANAGFDASSGATATRKILLNLADANGDLAKELGRPIKNLDDLAGAFKELEDKGINLGEALEITDVKSVAAFETFLKGTDSLISLRDGITDANDELEAMADKRLDTVSGQFTLLASAWEEWILAVNEGSGAGEIIKSLFTFLAENLPIVLTWVGRLISVFLIYKTRLIAMNVAQKLFNNEAGKMVLSLKTMISNLRGASKAGGKMGAALKGIGWAALIAFAATLALKFFDIATGADEARRQVNRLKTAQENAAKNLSELTTKAKKHYDEQIRLLDIEIRERKANGESEKILAAERIEREKEAAESGLKLITDTEKIKKDAITETLKLEDLARKVRDRQAKGSFRSTKEQLAETRKLARELRNQGFGGEITSETRATIASFQDLDVTINKLIARNSRLAQEIVGLSTAQEDYNALIDESNIQEKELDFKLKSTTGSVKARNTEFKKSIDLIKELNEETKNQIDLQNELRETQSGQEIAEAQDLIDAELMIQKIRIETQGTFNLGAIKALILERQQLEIDAILARRDFEIALETRNNAERFQRMREELEKEKAELIADGGDRLKIEANFQEEMRKIALIEEAAEDTRAEHEVILKENANNEILDNERQTADEIHDINLELTSDLNALLEQQKANAKKTADEKVKAAADAAKRIRALAKSLQQFLDKQSDKTIAEIDKEMAARQKQADHLALMSKEGTIQQDQSIKAEKARINELKKARIAEERAKQRRQLIATTYDIYQSKIEAGSTTPLSDTITDIGLLQAFIQTIPSNEKGTENTGPKGFGLDGKGGFLSMLHPYERVVDKGNNSMIPANMSNTELAQLANDSDRGALMYKAEMKASNGSGWQSAALLGKMGDVENAINDIPDFASHLEKLSDNVTYLVTKRIYKNKVLETARRIET